MSVGRDGGVVLMVRKFKFLSGMATQGFYDMRGL